jgi:DNA polymerase-3 subunit alpha
VDFYAALLTNEIGGDDDKLAEYFEELRDEGIKILPPDINTSGVHFTPDGANIRFGLAAIKGVGEAALRSILRERDGDEQTPGGGPFASLQDFVARCEKRAINSKVVECLIKCGAFDRFGHNRPSLLEAMPRVMEVAGSAREDKGSDQASLFDMMSEEDTADLNAEIKIPRLKDWDDRERLEIEKELAGFYLSGHPLERYEPDFAAFSTATAAQVARLRKGENVEWVGLIKRLVPRTDKNGNSFAFVECEDMTGPLELTFFAEAFKKSREMLKEGRVVWVRGRVDVWKDTHKILVDAGAAIDQVRAERIQALEVEVPWRLVSEASLTALQEIVARHKGRRKFRVLIRDAANEARVEAGGGFGVTPTTDLIRELQTTSCVQSVRFQAAGARR